MGRKESNQTTKNKTTFFLISVSINFGGHCEGGNCGKLQDDKAASAVEQRAKREAGMDLLQELLLSPLGPKRLIEDQAADTSIW